MTTVKNQVRKILAKSLSISSDEVPMNLSGDTVTSQSNDCYNDLCEFFAHLSASATGHSNNEQESNEQLMRKEAIQELVSQIFIQQHAKKQMLLIRIISKLVKNRIVEVRVVCEYMISNLVYYNGASSPTNGVASQPGAGAAPNAQGLANFNPNTPGNPGSNNPNSVSTSNANTNAKTTPPFIWCKVIECIIKFIPSQDYKTCRDIFKMLLEVVKRIPHANSSLPAPNENDGSVKSEKRKASQEDLKPMSASIAGDIQLESLYQVISFLLDSNNYFMPRYLAINEIKLVLSFGKEPYHQRFHSLITEFVNSFIPTANLISISGREKFLPIVGFSNLYSLYSFWRFNPGTCKFNTSGPLPYYKHASKPHPEVYHYLLRQNTPQYLLITLMSLHRNNKARFAIFEEEFSDTIVDTLRLSEEIQSIQENLRLWNNLVNQFLALNQIMNLTSLISQISAKLRKKNQTFKNSRDWLMWFLLLTISSLTNRNCTIEFSELFDILYKDEEPLPAPDQTQFISVIKMAPLAIWILLNIRPLSSQDPANAAAASSARSSLLNKPLKVPDVLRNHLALLQECMQNYSSSDFALSICMNAYSVDSLTFSPLLNNLVDKIGKSVFAPQQQPPSNASHAPSPSLINYPPLSFEMIASLSLHAKMHILNYLTYFLTQKQNMSKQLTFKIPAAIPETFARFLITDPENFLKYFTQNVWQFLNPPNLQPNSNTVSIQTQTVFVHQQLNLAIELIAYRFKHMSFTHRSTMLFHLNSLFTGQAQQLQAQANNPNQQQQTRPDQFNYIKHPQIYINAHCAIMKILSSLSGSDYYELLNSVYSNSKHGPKYYINPESEEINKAIVLVLARAINLTSSDLHPQFDNKDKDDTIRATLKQIYETTPIFFPDYVLEYFPKVMQQFIMSEQSKRPNERVSNERMPIDSSNKQYKMWLKKRVDDDYQRFYECRHETQAQTIFQNQSVFNTLLCVFFKLLQVDSSQINMNQYLQFIHSNLNGLENKKLSQSLRTLCDFLIIESANATNETLENYVRQIIQMIKTYNVFTYDRFLMIMTFRSFDAADFQLALRILNLLFVQNPDFDGKLQSCISLWNSYCNDKEDWSINFYSQYLNQHPEKFMYEGIKEQIGVQSNDSIINTYYGNLLIRCVPVLDFLNNRYIEIKEQSREMDQLLDYLNNLYVFNSNQLSYVYNSLMYYNNKFEATSINESGVEVFDNSKKKRLLKILIANGWKISPNFTSVFQKYAANLMNRDNDMMMGSNELTNIRGEINEAYYYGLLRRMLHFNKDVEFDVNKSEFLNPSCHLVYITICELVCLELFVTDGSHIEFSRGICNSILQLFFNKDYPIDKKELPYWINMAGMIIANLPEPYWHSIYDFLKAAIQRNELLAIQEPADPKEAMSVLLDHFDLTLATEKGCCDETTMLITLFHAVLTHANANHFLFFVKYLKECLSADINTEPKFLFICKLVGPFLSKIHIENTNLLLELVNNLYDMILNVSQKNENLYYLDTTCNFFYHLKYRHIGESIKEKIFAIMPSIRPELQKLLKYVTSEFSHMQQQQQQQQPPSVQQPSSVQSQRSV